MLMNAVTDKILVRCCLLLFSIHKVFNRTLLWVATYMIGLAEWYVAFEYRCSAEIKNPGGPGF